MWCGGLPTRYEFKAKASLQVIQEIDSTLPVDADADADAERVKQAVAARHVECVKLILMFLSGFGRLTNV